MKEEGRRMKAQDTRQKARGRPVTGHWSLVTLLLVAGCSQQPWVAEGNYFTYDHPFTEAAAESARQNALGRCRQRDEIAIQTSRVCSLTQCTTSYQCISADDARKIGEKK
jgi:hypothetical protein